MGFCVIAEVYVCGRGWGGLVVGCGGGVWGYGCGLICVIRVLAMCGFEMRVGWVLGFGLSVDLPAIGGLASLVEVCW